MKTIIDELKDEHSQLAEILREVKKFGIANPKGKEALIKAKNTLLNHLRKEDLKLYPLLRSHAKENPALDDLLNTFAKDMETVSTVAFDFFKKYEHADTSMEFARDFGTLYAALGNRIRKEESILYEEYNNIINSVSA
ncbi:MAG: hemerythrin domain-containing protein [Leptospiraceae bacterium]|nr:hemerythrin domain-containing protein [Leptospiraceae bacterium]